ncbi:hypothetical protein ACFOLF_15370 [Paenibacillus sepulcri]
MDERVRRSAARTGQYALGNTLLLGLTGVRSRYAEDATMGSEV